MRVFFSLSKREHFNLFIDSVLTTPISVIFDTLAGFSHVLDWSLLEDLSLLGGDWRQAFENK